MSVATALLAAVGLTAVAVIVLLDRAAPARTIAASDPTTATVAAAPAPRPVTIAVAPVAPTETAAPQADADQAATGTPTQVVAAVRDYYTLVPAHLDESWSLIGPDLRTRGGGFSDYENYWGQYSGVSVLDARSTGAMTVRVTILLLTDGSARFTEIHDLGLVSGTGGRLLIDTDALVSHTSTGH